MFRGVLEEPRDTSLSDSYTSDRCCFSSLYSCQQFRHLISSLFTRQKTMGYHPAHIILRDILCCKMNYYYIRKTSRCDDDCHLWCLWEDRCSGGGRSKKGRPKRNTGVRRSHMSLTVKDVGCKDQGKTWTMVRSSFQQEGQREQGVSPILSW